MSSTRRTRATAIAIGLAALSLAACSDDEFDVTTEERSGPLVRITIEDGLVTRLDEVYLA